MPASIIRSIVRTLGLRLIRLHPETIEVNDRPALGVKLAEVADQELVLVLVPKANMAPIA